MKTLFTTLIAAGLLAFGSAASAVVYNLTDPNIDELTDGLGYATVTITEEGDDVRFTVDPNDGAFDGILSNFGLQAFSFNYDTRTIVLVDDDNNPLTPDVFVYGVDLDVSGLAITDINPADWEVTNTNGSISEFGKFDFDLAGDGSSRADPLSFLITGVTGDTVDNYSVYFAGHIADFSTDICEATDEDGCTSYVSSAWFAGSDGRDRGLTPPEVPIPAAAWLFMSGLIGLVAVGRRKA